MDPVKRKRRRSAGSGRAIAVTGVHGSLAQRLLRRLDDDGRVSRLILVDRTSIVAPLDKAASYRVDLTEPNADGHLADIFRREEVAAVVHLAFHRRPGADPETAHELESVGTMHVVGGVAQAAALSSGLEHLLVVSSALVYGADPHAPAVHTEADPLRGCPGYPFIEEKLDAERQLEAARGRLALPVTVLRPSLTLSPGDDGVAAAYFGSAIVPTLWGCDPLVQLIHEDDVVEACRLALNRRPSGTYNIAGTRPLPLGTLVRLAGKVAMPLLPFAAPAVIDALWRVGLSPVPGAHAPYLRHSLVIDGARAGDDLGFRPRRSTAETLEHFMGRRLPLAA
jgi:UDP-glucose 4-epimerase